jgi:hypothetical protein
VRQRRDVSSSEHSARGGNIAAILGRVCVCRRDLCYTIQCLFLYHDYISLYSNNVKMLSEVMITQCG